MGSWRITRFGNFELDRGNRELRKRGLRIHLQEQPLAILELLLERAGELVSRSDLQRRLWPGAGYGDFERGLNAAVTRLRQALNDSAANPRYFETIPRRGYRFIASVKEGGRQGKASGSDLRRLVVLPFQQLLADPDTAFLCFSLPDAIMNSLAGVESLVIVSNRLANTGDLPSLAESGVNALMSGTLLRSGDGIRVSTQLVEVPTGDVVWTHNVQAPLGELFWLQDELTRRITESLLPSVSVGAHTPPRASVPASARAYDYFLRANQLAQEMRDLPLARDFYRRCLDEDPKYAPAWAQLARCHRILAKFGADPHANLASAEDAFERAFALHPQLPGIHGIYAFHETEQGRAPAAIGRLVECLQRNRYDPGLYTSLVSACRYAGLIEESRAAHAAGRRLDPRLRTSIMNTHLVMGEYEEALAASTDNVGFMDAMVLDELGRREEALERLQRPQNLPPLMKQWLEALEAYLKGRADAFERLMVVERQAVDPEGFHYRARLFARLGQREQCLATLGEAAKRGFGCAAALAVDRAFDGVRDDLRFQELVARAEAWSEAGRSALQAAGHEKVFGGSPAS